jgi:hypothetical protein
MPKLNVVERPKAVHLLVYGPPKVGKTKLVGELAQHGFTLHFFDLENGSMTLNRSLPSQFQENVNLFRIPDTRDFCIAVETMLKIQKAGVHKICWEHGKIACPLCDKDKKSFDTFDNTTLGPKDIIVVDSMTQLSNSAMNNIGKGKTDDWKPEWDDYNKQGRILDRFCSSIQNSLWNWIVITHDLLVDTTDGKNEKIVPVAGTSNFSRTVAKYFDEVVYCQVRNKQHEAASSTTYNLGILTGSRSHTAIESQDKNEMSLLPIFVNQGIGVNAASVILQQSKNSLGVK